MNCALYRLKRRLNKLQSMHIAHLPPCFKGLMRLRGEKKEVIVTDKYQHTPNPQAKGALNNDCSLHLGIIHSHWLDERKRTEGRMKQDASGIHLMGMKFLVKLVHTGLSAIASPQKVLPPSYLYSHLKI